MHHMSGKLQLHLNMKFPPQRNFVKELHIHLKNIHIWWQNKMEKIVGYAYVSPFKERAAYAWAVETSIYVDQNCKRMGIGKKTS